MIVQKVGYGFALVLCALVGCSSGHNSTRLWLTYSQGDAASYFGLTVISNGTASVSARGPFANETRTVGQTSDAELTPAQIEELEALVDAGLLEVYEADDAIAAGSNVGSAIEPAFYVSLNADALDSPAPRDVWSRGEKSGPNPDIAELRRRLPARFRFASPRSAWPRR